ncbi:MAG: L,D-transpeptidase family protein [Hydrococcus sp. Prado102]|nr:L,D-transpeptidase family protein [Hydrococcus sp. Prado102]
MYDKGFVSIIAIAFVGLMGLGGCSDPTNIQIDKPSAMKTSNPSKSSLEKNTPFTIKIDRVVQQMQVIDPNGAEVIKTPIGIGRGGLKSKRDMMDYVTPTGEFVVDLILYQQESFNRVSPQLHDRYLNSEFRELFAKPQGLKELFHNMNSLDFDGNRTPDRSYGIAYIGLNATSTNSVVTGPKMRYASWQGGENTPYWFSIALHGTPEEKTDIGAANSGGCIHVPQQVLKKLVEEGIVKIGTPVIISDSE